ncbi:MAG: tRNA (N6-isopentenyl adenosine(37)-C2)-methylthiotransferase MiaB [Deltaproteobacteria bacterium]|nr:tRNA (N6-isopentenyl adenosine(37)-C2)-methylthiotransferase MiaB [Deltaproteobacteria bacterium]
MTRRFYIETYGCQMNVADSELITGILEAAGYVSAKSEEEADVILLNTCAVREKAEERIFGRLGWLKTAKAKRPGLTVGVAGCMAEHLKEALVKRAPYVDVVIGPDAYRRLPALLDAAVMARDPLIDVVLDKAELYEGIAPTRVSGVSGWISIARGCDKFCTFCVVPYTRGRERSVEPGAIVAQAVAMEASGFSEVTLLGQTVSSYQHQGTDFAALLRAVHDATERIRLRFTSPYPTDFSDAVLDTLAALPRVGQHLHLPVQSGSTPVLEAMRRQYTAEDYLDLIARIEARLPDYYLTTDFIVGFPGETDEDFERTLALAEGVRFDSAFMFKYSERPLTYAAKKIPDDIPEAVKNARLQRLIKVQEAASRSRAAERVGREVEVLVSGENPKKPGQAMGRTSCFKTTILDRIDGEASPAPGDWVRARVHGSSVHTLFATPLGSASIEGVR